MARPLVVRVGDLPREPGSRRDVDRDVDLGVLATSAAGTVPDTDVVVRLVVLGMAGGVEITGSVRFAWTGECRRCLEDVVGATTIPIREIAQRNPTDDEILPIDDDLLDLEPLVREVVLAGLPLAPLCDAECRGPDPDRFPATPEVDLETAEEPAPDPRWAALADLTFDGD